MVGRTGHAVDFTGFDVSNMKVEAPLIALAGEKTHVFRVHAEADWRLNQIQMSLGSANEAGKITRRHATFFVLVSPGQTWLREWKRLTHLVQGRVDSLVKGVAEGSCHHIKRGMAYKLFSALVDYGKDYQGMKDVIMDSDQLEAVSTVEFQVGSEGFCVNPRWIDSLGHIAGFIMNANDSLASKSTVFVNHGWDHMRIAEPLEVGKTYRAYNRMQPLGKSLYAGDTYIFECGRLIAVFEGVTVCLLSLCWLEIVSSFLLWNSIKANGHAISSSKASHGSHSIICCQVKILAEPQFSRSTLKPPRFRLRYQIRQTGNQFQARVVFYRAKTPQMRGR